MVKSAFQNWPQRLVSRIVLTCLVLENLFRSFSIIDWYIDGRNMSIELRAELSFLALFMKASSKMRYGEIELCFKKEFLFSTIKYLNMSLAFKIFLVLKIYR